MNSYSSDQAVTGSTGVIGHYTQVVWAETAEVGCGYMTSFVNDRLESVKIFLFLISFMCVRIVWIFHAHSIKYVPHQFVIFLIIQGVGM